MPSNDLRTRARGGAPAQQNSGDASARAVDMLNRTAADFAMVLPSHLDAQQWLRIAAGLLRRNPKLAAAAMTNPQSFFGALLDCARLGLVPGDTYHLIPFGRETQGIVDVSGEVELIYRAGMVRKIVCQVVREGDDFAFVPGEDDHPRHRIDWSAGDRAKRPLWLVYAYAEFKDGGYSDVVVMDASQIAELKAVSRSASQSDSPWKKWEDRMWKKSAVKQLSKTVPSSAEFRTEQLRAEAAVQTSPSGYGQLPPARDYDPAPMPLPTSPSPVAIEAEFATHDGQPVNTSTGELPPTDVQELPDDAAEFDPTADPNWRGGAE